MIANIGTGKSFNGGWLSMQVIYKSLFNSYWSLFSSHWYPEMLAMNLGQMVFIVMQFLLNDVFGFFFSGWGIEEHLSKF